MKIGIVTYHRSHNYGALLQAIASRLYLEQKGNEVFFIDYWPEHHFSLYNKVSLKKFLRKNLWKGLMAFIHYIITFRVINKRYNSFASFIDKHIVPYCKPTFETFDIIMYGSDQIWKKQKNHAYDSVYFGNNNFITSKHVAFSASINDLPQSTADRQVFSVYLSHLDEISVREKMLQEYILSIGYKNVYRICDPTFLLSASEWDKLIPPKYSFSDKYILLYEMHIGTFDIDKIKRFATTHGLRLHILYGIPKKESSNIHSTYGPDGFLDLIRNAELVFTSSFHGLAFSIIYNKQFYASFSKGAIRGKSILEDLCLNHRYIEPMNDIPDNQTPIDYEVVNIKLCNMRKHTDMFINQICK